MKQSENTRMHRLLLEVRALSAEASSRQDGAHTKESKEYWRGRHEVAELLIRKIDKYIDEEATD